MIDVTKLTVTATAETALRKLKKAGISVFDCKKDGARFIFSVKDKQLKKAFAIFAKPCYNISIVGKSSRNRLSDGLLNRIGLIIGGIIFAAVAVISNSFVFKINVSGSGSYLSPEVRRIIYECGAKEFKLFSDFDEPAAICKILALPQVTFCNIEKRGSVLRVDVQIDDVHSSTAQRTPLVSDRAGKVRNVTAICGTVAVNIGDDVSAGSTLIAAYTLAGEIQTECLAVGYAELECRGRTEYFATEESEENLKAAYSAALMEGEEILTRTHTVKPADGGVVYVLEFTYLHKLSINME